MLIIVSCVFLIFIKLIQCINPIGVLETSSMYFCSDVNPQSHVDIEQLMGMWYAIEIISHDKESRYEIVQEEGCPVLYFSEDKTPTSTYSPLYRNFMSKFGNRYGGGSIDRQYGADITTEYDLYGLLSTNGYNNYDYESDPSFAEIQNKIRIEQIQRERFGGEEYERVKENERLRKLYGEIKRLRLLWDEKGTFTDYNLRYNTTKAGFWFSSGPNNGSSLEPQFNHFAGTVQVLKAVGNHMVLLFCHQLPDRQLYTVLLSRVQTLSRMEIHGVHNLLQRRGLPTTSIRKVCMHSTANVIRHNTFLSMLITISSIIILHAKS